ncbi:MAG: hypothetical protein MUP19_03310 [Candidatus Aminicenantes bacterium]|nr:hypothetical protein [Candidatus Aminicenantes bacterium]
MANSHLAGAYPVSVYFRFDDARTPENLRLMRHYENYLLSCPKIYIPFSIVDLVEELNFQGGHNTLSLIQVGAHKPSRAKEGQSIVSPFY